MERVDINQYLDIQAHLCIAPDGSDILFEIDSGCYLFISFKQADGKWGDAVDLEEHGFNNMAGGATISPDGRYMFLALDQDVWWVDTAVLL